MPIFDIDNVVRLEATFKNASDTNTDPTTVTLQHQDPTGNETTLTFAAAELTNSAVGIYHFDLTVDEAGTWYYKFKSTGTPKTSAEDNFDVRVSEF